MSTVNELKVAAIVAYTGQAMPWKTNELEAIWLQGEGYTGTLNEMYIQYFQANGSTSGRFHEAAAQFFITLGYTGSISEMWYQFWLPHSHSQNLPVIRGRTVMMFRSRGVRCSCINLHWWWTLIQA